jgi:aspartate kinase
LQQTENELGASLVEADDQIVKIALVGVGMRSHAAIASNMFKALSEEQINIKMISTSEIKVSVIVDEKYLELAVRTLHQAFDLDQPETKHTQNICD